MVEWVGMVEWVRMVEWVTIFVWVGIVDRVATAGRDVIFEMAIWLIQIILTDSSMPTPSTMPTHPTARPTSPCHATQP